MRYSEYGQDEFKNMRAVEEIQVVNYDHADLDSEFKLKIPIEKDTLILDVGHLVTEAFAGGTPALTVGDGDDADGYLSLAAADLDAIGHMAWSKGRFSEADGVATKVAFCEGKNYAAAGYLLLTHQTGLTAGKGKVLIKMLKLGGNWRVPAL